MNRRLTKSIISILLALVLAVACVSMTAFAEGESEIAVSFAEGEGDTLKATVKLKNPSNAVTAGALFIEYDDAVISTAADKVTYQAGKVGTIIGEGEDAGNVSVQWMHNPPLEAKNEYTNIAEITFTFNEGKTLADLADDSFKVGSSIEFMNTAGGYGATEGALLVNDGNEYSIANDAVVVNFGDLPEVEPATVAVTGVTVKETETVEAGKKITILATVAPENASNKTVTWSSSDTTVATVDAATGEVTGVAEGTAVITATTADGGKTDTCTVTVNAANPTPSKTIKEVLPSTLTTNIGTIPTFPAKVTVKYTDETTGEVAVQWDTASITSDKYTTAGEFVVEGEVEGTELAAECKVTVTDPKAITEVKDTKIETKINSIPTLPKEVTVTFADKTTGKAAVTWETIATDALVKAGTFDIYGKVEGTDIEAKCTITVKEKSNGDDDGDKDSPDTGDSIVGISIAAILALVSFMIMVMCYNVIMKKRGGKLVKASANNGGNRRTVGTRSYVRSGRMPARRPRTNAYRADRRRRF